jgi:hypothetical protein
METIVGEIELRRMCSASMVRGAAERERGYKQFDVLQYYQNTGACCRRRRGESSVGGT